MAYNNVKVKARQTVTQSSTQTDKLGTVSEVPMGEWNINTPYKKLNKVRYVSTGGSGVTLLAKKNNQGVEPFISNGWQEVWMVETYDGGAVSPDGTYPDMTVGNATNAQNDGTGTNIANQFAEVAQDIQGLRDDITNESHFRGMFESVEALQAAYPTATPNDYAYIVGGNIYIWQNNAWVDSHQPSPNTAVPASNSTPLMDGTGSAGTSSEYSRGDHRHPSDNNKVNKSGDTIDGDLIVNGGMAYRNGNNSTFLELGKFSGSGIEFHSQSAESGAYLDYDAFIQANNSTSTTTPGTAQLIYHARQHLFQGPIIAEGNNAFIYHGNEFNFIPQGYDSYVWLNYRGGNVEEYRFCNGDGKGGLSPVRAHSLYEGEKRVYSPNNLPYSYIGGTAWGQILFKDNNAVVTPAVAYYISNASMAADSSRTVYASDMGLSYIRAAVAVSRKTTSAGYPGVLVLSLAAPYTSVTVICDRDANEGFYLMAIGDKAQ